MWVRLSTGVAALLGGLLIVATTPRQGIAFRPFDSAQLVPDLPRDRPVLLDFSADWCVPCHELDRYTFTDRRVKEAAKAFDAYKVDLTRYDSPQAERWRRRFHITGVPTIVFLDRSGRELREARVEGFIPPAPLLDRMRYVAERTQTPITLPAAAGRSR